MNQKSDLTRLSSERKYTLEESQSYETEFLKQDPPPDEEDLRKWFFYEFSPIVRICESLNNPSIQITFPKRDAPCDGEITANDKTVRIECVRAVDGHNEKLMLELLELEHQAPVFDKIKFNGTKNGRQFHDNTGRRVTFSPFSGQFDLESLG